MNTDRFRPFKIILALLILIDAVIWGIILFSNPNKQITDLYFLNVGQGDSSLAVLPSGVKALIDGGPINGKLKNNLESILPINDRYIDLVFISHPQVDHYGGLLDILTKYKIGAILTNGSGSNDSVWQEMKAIIKRLNIPIVDLAAGDKIKSQGSIIDILSPDISYLNNANDNCLVLFLNTSGGKAIFTGDISSEIEKRLTNLYELNADVLKVSHHGSKYSSNLSFLKEVSPAISVIEVGKNSYGHPTEEVLNRLKEISSQIFRTDKNGLIKLEINNGQLKIFQKT